MRNKKVHRVRMGTVEGVGDSKTFAKADLNSQLEWLTNPAADPISEVRYGLVLSAHPVARGWVSRVFDPVNIPHGQAVAYSTMQAPCEREEMLDSLRYHACQTKWHNMISDDEFHVHRSGCTESKKSDLRRWIKFQRDYIRLISEGKTPNEAHAIATGDPRAVAAYNLSKGAAS